MEVLKKTKRRLWLFLFLVIAVVAVNCVRCQDLEEDHHYSRNNRKTLGDAELAAESAHDKNKSNKSNGSSSLPSAVTHVRTKRLNGNIQLTTMEVGTPGQENAAHMLDSIARTPHNIHEHPSMSSRRTTNAPAAPDGPSKSEARKDELMDGFSRPNHTSAGTWFAGPRTRSTTEKQMDDGTLSPPGLIYARQYHEAEKDGNYGTTEMDTVVAEEVTETTMQVVDGFEDGTDDRLVTTADEFYSIFGDNDGDISTTDSVEDSTFFNYIPTSDVSSGGQSYPNAGNFNGDNLIIQTEDDSRLTPEGETTEPLIAVTENTFQDIYSAGEQLKQNVELNSLHFENEELIPASISNNQQRSFLDHYNTEDFVTVATDVSNYDQGTNFEDITILPQVANMGVTDVVGDSTFTPENEASSFPTMRRNHLSAVQNIYLNTELPRRGVEMNSSFLENEEFIPAYTLNNQKPILFDMSEVEDSVSVTTDISRNYAETTFEGTTLRTQVTNTNYKNPVEDTTLVPKEDPTTTSVITENLISGNQNNELNAEFLQPGVETNSPFFENEELISARTSKNQEPIYLVHDKIEDPISVTTDVSSFDQYTTFEGITMLLQIANTSNKNVVENSTFVPEDVTTFPAVITESPLSAIQNINLNTQHPQADAEMNSSFLENEEMIPTNTIDNHQKSTIPHLFEIEDNTSVTTEISSNDVATFPPQVINMSNKNLEEDTTFMPEEEATIPSVITENPLSAIQNINSDKDFSQQEVELNSSFLENEELILASTTNDRKSVLSNLSKIEVVSVTTDISSNDVDTFSPQVTNMSNINLEEDTTLTSEKEATIPSVITENPLSAIQNINSDKEFSKQEVELNSSFLENEELILASTTNDQKSVLSNLSKIEVVSVTTDISSNDVDTFSPQVTKMSNKYLEEDTTFMPEEEATVPSVITENPLSAIQNINSDKEFSQQEVESNSSFLENEELILASTTNDQKSVLSNLPEIEVVSVTTDISSNDVDTFPPQVTNMSNKYFEEDTTFMPEEEATIPSVITENPLSAIQNINSDKEISQQEVELNLSFLENEDLIEASTTNDQKSVLSNLSKTEDVSVTTDTSGNDAETTFESTTIPPQTTNIDYKNPLEGDATVPSVIMENPLPAIQTFNSNMKFSQSEVEIDSMLLEREELIPARTSKNQNPNLLVRYKTEDSLSVTTDVSRLDQDTTSEGIKMSPQITNISDKSVVENLTFVPEDESTVPSVITENQLSTIQNNNSRTELPQPDAELNSSFLVSEELIPVNATGNQKPIFNNIFKVEDNMSVTTDSSSNDVETTFESATFLLQVTNISNKNLEEDATFVPEEETTLLSVITENSSAATQNVYPQTKLPQPDVELTPLFLKDEELIPASASNNQEPILSELSNSGDDISVKTDISSSDANTVFESTTFPPQAINANNQDPVDDTTLVAEDVTANLFSATQNMHSYTEHPQQGVEMNSLFLENEALIPTVMIDQQFAVAKNVVSQMDRPKIENNVPVATYIQSFDQDTSFESTTDSPQVTNISEKSNSTFVNHEELVKSSPNHDITKKDYDPPTENIFTEKEYSENNADLNLSIIFENEDLIPTETSHRSEKSKMDGDISVTTDMSSFDGGNTFDAITISQWIDINNHIKQSTLSISQEEITKAQENAILPNNTLSTNLSPFESNEFVLSNTTLLLDTSKFDTTVLMTTDVTNHDQQTLAETITITNMPQGEVHITTGEPVSAIKNILGYTEELPHFAESDSSFLENEELIPASASSIPRDTTLNSSQSGRMIKQLQSYSGTKLNQREKTTSDPIRNAEATTSSDYVTEISDVDSTSDAEYFDITEKAFESNYSTTDENSEAAKEVSSLSDIDFSTLDTIEFSTQTFKPLNDISESSTQYSAVPDQPSTVQSASVVAEEINKKADSITSLFITEELEEVNSNQLNDVMIEESKIVELTTVASAEEGIAYSTLTEYDELNRLEKPTIRSTDDKKKIVEENTGDYLTGIAAELLDEFLEFSPSEDTYDSGTTGIINVTTNDSVTENSSTTTPQVDVRLEEASDVDLDPKKKLSSIWGGLQKYCNKFLSTPETCLENLLSATAEDYFATTTESIEQTVIPAVEFDGNYVLKALLSEEERILDSIRQDLQRYHDFLKTLPSTEATTQLAENPKLPTKQTGIEETLKNVLSEENNFIASITEDLQQYRDLIATRQLVEQYLQYSTSTLRNDWEETQQTTGQYATGRTIKSIDHVTSNSVESTTDDMEKVTTQFTEHSTIYNRNSKAVDVLNNEKTIVELLRSASGNIDKTTESLNDDGFVITTQLVENPVDFSREPVPGNPLENSLSGFVGSSTKSLDQRNNLILATEEPTSTDDNWVKTTSQLVENSVTSTGKSEIGSLTEDLNKVIQHRSKKWARATTKFGGHPTTSAIELVVGNIRNIDSTRLGKPSEYPTFTVGEDTQNTHSITSQAKNLEEVNSYTASENTPDDWIKTTPQSTENPGNLGDRNSNRINLTEVSYSVENSAVADPTIQFSNGDIKETTKNIDTVTELTNNGQSGPIIQSFEISSDSENSTAEIASEGLLTEIENLITENYYESTESTRTARTGRNLNRDSHGTKEHESQGTLQSSKTSDESRNLKEVSTEGISVVEPGDVGGVSRAIKINEKYLINTDIYTAESTFVTTTQESSILDGKTGAVLVAESGQDYLEVENYKSTTFGDPEKFELSTTNFIPSATPMSVTEFLAKANRPLDLSKVSTEINILELIDGKQVIRKPAREELESSRKLRMARNFHAEEFHDATMDNSTENSTEIEDLSSFMTVDNIFMHTTTEDSTTTHKSDEAFNNILSILNPVVVNKVLSKSGATENPTGVNPEGMSPSELNVTLKASESTIELPTSTTQENISIFYKTEEVSSSESRSTTYLPIVTRQENNSASYQTQMTTESKRVENGFTNGLETTEGSIPENPPSSSHPVVLSPGSENSTYPLVFKKQEYSSTSIPYIIKINTELNFPESSSANKPGSVLNHKEEESVISNDSDGTTSNLGENNTHSSGSAGREETSTSVFGKTETATEVDYPEVLSINEYMTTRSEVTTDLPNSTKQRDILTLSFNETAVTTAFPSIDEHETAQNYKHPIYLRPKDKFTLVPENTEITTDPIVLEFSSTNTYGTTQLYRQEKSVASNLRNELDVISTEAYSTTNLPISTRQEKMSTSIFDTVETMTEFNYLNLFTTNIHETAQNNPQEKSTSPNFSVDSDVSSSQPGNTIHLPIFTRQENVFTKDFDTSETTTEINFSVVPSTTIQGSSRKYRQDFTNESHFTTNGPENITDLPTRRETISELNLETNEQMSFSEVPLISALETNQKYKQAESNTVTFLNEPDVTTELILSTNREENATPIVDTTEATPEVSFLDVSSTNAPGTTEEYRQEKPAVLHESDKTSTGTEKITDLPISTREKYITTPIFGNNEITTEVNSSGDLSTNTHGTTQNLVIPNESHVTSTLTEVTTDLPNSTKRGDISALSFDETELTTEFSSTDAIGTTKTHREETSAVPTESDLITIQPESTSNLPNYTRQEYISTHIFDKTEGATGMDVSVFSSTNTHEKVQTYREEKSVVSHSRIESDVVSTAPENTTDSPTSTLQEGTATPNFDKTETITQLNSLKSFSTNIQGTTQNYIQEKSQLLNSSDESDITSSQPVSITDPPISTRQQKVSTVIPDQSETTTGPNFLAVSSDNIRGSTQKYRQEKIILPNSANVTNFVTSGNETVTDQPMSTRQETISSPSLETNADANLPELPSTNAHETTQKYEKFESNDLSLPNEPGVATNESGNITDVTISIQREEITISTVDVTEATREVNFEEVSSTGAGVTTGKYRGDKSDEPPESNIFSTVPENITDFPIHVKQGDITIPYFDKTDITETNSLEASSSNTHGTTQKYRQGKLTVPNYPNEQDIIEQEEIDTSTLDTFDSITDFPFLQVVPSKTYKGVEADEKLTSHSNDIEGEEVGDMEPQITGNVLGKPINITVKINDNGSTFFVPPDAFLGSSSISRALNITWKSASSHMNNSLFISPHDIDDGLAQLNLVRDDQMYIYRKNGNRSKLQSAGHKIDSDAEVKVITLEDGVQVFFSVTDFEKIKQIYATEISLDEPPTEPIVSRTFSVKAHYAFVASSIGGVLVIVAMYAMKQIWNRRNTNGFSPNADNSESVIVQLT